MIIFCYYNSNQWVLTKVLGDSVKKEENVLFCYISFYQNQDKKGKEMNHCLFHVTMIVTNGCQSFLGWNSQNFQNVLFCYCGIKINRMSHLQHNIIYILSGWWIDYTDVSKYFSLQQLFSDINCMWDCDPFLWTISKSCCLLCFLLHPSTCRPQPPHDQLCLSSWLALASIPVRKKSTCS